MEPNGRISMYKLIKNRVVLSILIFSSEMVLCACGDNRNETAQVQILEEVGEELTDAEEDSVIQDLLTESSNQVEVTIDEENEKIIRGSIPDGSRDLIEYLFNYLYPDQSEIRDIELYETEDTLYYRYWFENPYTGENEAPTVLCFSYATSDRLYQEYAIYAEIWHTYHDENGIAQKEHIRNSYGNYWLINTSTREVIPQWIYNSDAEDDASYCIDNDRYWEVIDMYHGKGETSTDDMNVDTKTESLGWEWFIEPEEYEDIILCDENLIAVKESLEGYRLIDENKNIISEEKYANVFGSSEKIVKVIDDDTNYFFVDSYGNHISQEKFQDAGDFYEGIAAVKKGNKWGFIDSSGNIIIDYQYDSVDLGFHGGLAAVKISEKWYFVDQQGNLAWKTGFEDATDFSEGYAAVKKDGKWGYIDIEGTVKIDFQYEAAKRFSENKAAVMKSIDGYEKWAYINTNNEIVVDYNLYGSSEGRLVLVGEFHNGHALVTDVLYCLINESGEVVLGDDSCFLTEGSSYDSQGGLIVAYDYLDNSMKETKYGLVDIEGNVVIPFIFDHISEVKGDFAKVLCEQDGKMETGVIKIVQK